MSFTFSQFFSKARDYTPKSVICFQEKYTKEIFLQDLFAGVSVGIIALPLALAFAIGSGVSPERGLYTAIVAGFLISLLGGSRVQIGGPTGAYVPIVYSIVQQHGYEGLAIATVIGGILMILMGIARCGVLLKFIPYPVTTGFTTGIAVVILSTQVKDFFGLQLNDVPPEFLEKCKLFCLLSHTWSPWAISISLGTLFLTVVLRRMYPRFPAALFAVIAATLVAYFFHFPVETIQSKFGNIPRTLPLPSFPSFSYEQIQKMFPDAITIALLGAIESLLSAVVADGATGNRHRSNCELVAQGFANIGSIVFGGIPATGAIARTSANIRLGAKTPVAGMTHAITLLLLMLLFAPYAGKIPLAALSGVLILVAWNMSELENFYSILRGQKSDAIVLIITFLLTVLIDLAVAVQAGVILAAILFLKHMSDSTTVQASKIVLSEDAHMHPEIRDGDILFRNDIPKNVEIFEIKGPFFYSVSEQLNETLSKLDQVPHIFILRMRHVPLIDSTGINALGQFALKCKQKGIILLLSGIRGDLEKILESTHLEKLIGRKHIFPHIDATLAYARNIESYEK